MIALTRSVPQSIIDCELTHLKREPIDFKRAAEQHAKYEQALSELGCTIHQLAATPDLPDSVFVEDMAAVLPEVAIIARPGAESRRAEVPSVAEALGGYCSLAFIEPPGTLDGGDVLTIGSTIYAGESSRTNEEAIRQLGDVASIYGYNVRSVRVSGCLHLKSAVTRVGDEVVLLNPAWIDASVFSGLRQIDVHPNEPFAANALLVDKTVIYATTYAKTCERLEQNGIDVHSIEMDELHKAEGAVTCCSILISA
ncbi:MAG TPA: N(G),N(G)-dimethylarginine dimethylaminohydrolase [Gemmatimonadaceae bacterium]|nr:N(G),N(G)-dimethylarginine dimethylaminohydrolase [Gemmatimonadaceae bacterium]